MISYSIRIISPLFVSHIRAVLSLEAVTTNLSSGLNTANITLSVCPVNECIYFPVRASHKQAVLSSEAVITYFPSLLNVAELTASSCPFRKWILSMVCVSQIHAVPSQEAVTTIPNTSCTVIRRCYNIKATITKHC